MPLTKTQLIDKTTAFAKAYKIPLSSIVVSAGGSMLMHGFKETTNDIDASVEFMLFKETAAKAGRETEWLPGLGATQGCYICHFPEFDLDLHSGRFMENAVTDLVSVNGITVLTINALLRQKQAMGRDKDKRDVEVIRARLGV